MQILFCEQVGIVRILYLIKTFLNLGRLILPIGLILMVAIDISKSVLSQTLDSKDNTIRKIGNRILACIIVFCVPTLINLLMALIGQIGFDTNSHDNTLASCYTNATPELINTLEEQQKLKLEKELEEKRKNAVAKAAEYEANRQNQVEKNRENITSSGSTYDSNLTDLNKQNQVYVQNGTFYAPKYHEGNKDTYSGRNCPSNPLNEGYNNKHGYNNHFYTMLQNLINGAKAAGYNLSISNQGCRPYSTQLDRYNKYNETQKGRFAKPGRSNHGWGIASDVTFYKNSSDKCGSSRTYKNCPGMKWVHDHAKDYGLHFPLINASYKEDWHIEPINLKKY